MTRGEFEGLEVATYDCMQNNCRLKLIVTLDLPTPLASVLPSKQAKSRALKQAPCEIPIMRLHEQSYTPSEFSQEFE